MSLGTKDNVRFGPGQLFVAALGSPEPTDLATGWDAAWRPLGFTKDGSTMSYAPDVQAIEVAEVLGPIKYATVNRKLSIKFELGEITAKNLKVAFNGGTINVGSGFVTFVPPVLGGEAEMMIGWEATDHLERWVGRQCIQSGSADRAAQKAPNFGTLPVEFWLEEIDEVTSPFLHILDDSLA